MCVLILLHLFVVLYISCFISILWHHDSLKKKSKKEKRTRKICVLYVNYKVYYTWREWSVRALIHLNGQCLKAFLFQCVLVLLPSLWWKEHEQEDYLYLWRWIWQLCNRAELIVRGSLLKKRGEKSPSEIVSMESVININSSMNPAALCYFHLNEVARTLLRDVGVLQYDLDMNCLGMFLYVNIASHFGIAQTIYKN